MLHNLGQSNSLISHLVSELRDINIQNDRARFRRNLGRIAGLIGFEISKQLPYVERDVTTPLAVAKCQVLREIPVLATILRAGLAMHQGLLELFEGAECAYISAYRKHNKDGSFEIALEYIACPDLTDKILILSDPMLGTGASMVLTLKELFKSWKPREIHTVSAIAARPGVEHVTKELPHVHIWTAAIDDALNSKAYIVPGLGDAGDLAFGGKVQN